MAELGRACGSGRVTTDGGGASAVGAAAGAALSRSDALSPVADATVAASLVGDGSKTQRIGAASTAGRFGHAQTGRCHGLGLFSFKSLMLLEHAWSSAERQVQLSLYGTWH